MNNDLLFSRNNGNIKDVANKSERVHKNSMEEWEERLKGKKIRKHSKSAVDRIIEKNEQKHKNLLKLNEKSCSNDKLEVKSKNGFVRNSNKRLKHLSNIENSKVARPKSLDRDNNFSIRSLGILNQFQYYSKEDILHADDEASEADLEVAAINTNRLQIPGTRRSGNILRKKCQNLCLNVSFPVFNLIKSH